MSIANPPGAHIKRLMEGAVNDAFQEQIGHIYKIYLANVTHPDKQKNAQAGIANAIAAYRLAMSAVDAWQE